MDTTTTEKIYCMPSDNSSLNPMLSALLSKDSSAETAALLNNQNGWNNNPFVYLVWMMMMRYMGTGWGDNAGAENFNSRQIATLQDTVANNHNNDLVMQAMNNNQSAIRELAQTFNSDITTIQMAIGGVKSAVEGVAGQVGMTGQQVINSVLLGNKDLTSALQSCCCENKQLVTTMGYEGQLRDQANTAALTSRIDQLANGITQGFASTAYANQQQTCDIINAINTSQQKTADLLNNHWVAEQSQELQNARFEISQMKQNQLLLSAINGGCSCNQ